MRKKIAVILLLVFLGAFFGAYGLSNIFISSVRAAFLFDFFSTIFFITVILEVTFADPLFLSWFSSSDERVRFMFSSMKEGGAGFTRGLR